MHSIAEIVIPPNVDVKLVVGQIMDYFREEKYDADGNELDERGEADWWDFWVIGGRFSGHKTEARLDQDKLTAFHELLKERKVTVSGLVCGKEDLNPASQIPMVDALWREWFPGTGDKCPLFNHARDQYRKDGYYADDVCTVAEVPERLECVRLIVAGPHWKEKDRFIPKRMLVTEYWNRVEHQKSDWDGKVKPALAAMMGPDVREHRKIEATPEWWVVTVDCHN